MGFSMTYRNKLAYSVSTFKQAFKDNSNRDFTQGSIGTAAFLLAVPMVLEMAMESVFAITDIFWVSFLGADAVAVVGLTEAVITLLYAVGIGISMSVTALVARRIGEKDRHGANQIAGQTIWIGGIVALVVASIGGIYGKQILQLVGGHNDVVALGESYTTVMLCGSITILYLFLFNAIFRGAGDASIAMRSLWLANGINIVLDPLLIFGIGPFPELGVTGAAVATTIGRGVGVIYQLYHLCGAHGRISVELSHLKFLPSTILSIVKLSIGGVLQFIIATASWVVLVRIVASYGSAAVAGYTIAVRVIIFTILPAWGLSNAVATLVGQNLGAGKPDRAERSVWKIARYNLFFMLVVASVFIIFADSIIDIFTHDPLAKAYGVNCLHFISYGYGFYAIGMVLVQAFNGAGDTMTPTKINFLCFWLFQIPLAYWLAFGQEFGPKGVFMAVMLAESVMAAVAIFVFRRGRWKLMVV